MVVPQPVRFGQIAVHFAALSINITQAGELTSVVVRLALIRFAQKSYGAWVLIFGTTWWRTDGARYIVAVYVDMHFAAVLGALGLPIGAWTLWGGIAAITDKGSAADPTLVVLHKGAAKSTKDAAFARAVWSSSTFCIAATFKTRRI
jgi:hypothetical protein